MGLRILYDPEMGRAVLYDSTTERALDHEAFMDVEEAEDFIEWYDGDPRRLSPTDFTWVIGEWRAEAFDGDEFVGAASRPSTEQADG